MHWRINRAHATSKKRATLFQTMEFVFARLSEEKNANGNGTNGDVGLAHVQIARPRIPFILG